MKLLDNILIWTGLLLDDRGEGVNDGKVQIWHADPNGVYDHPSFPGQWDLYPDFQYYGTASTDNNGRFEFQTYRPGIYPQRPITHIHVRVFLGGELKLTTQMYFADEDPNYPESLILNVEEVKDDGSNYYHATTKNLVIDLRSGGNLTKTPEQQAGPFYPLEDFFSVGSNLILPLPSDICRFSLHTFVRKAYEKMTKNLVFHLGI